MIYFIYIISSLKYIHSEEGLTREMSAVFICYGFRSVTAFDLFFRQCVDAIENSTPSKENVQK